MTKFEIWVVRPGNPAKVKACACSTLALAEKIKADHLAKTPGQVIEIREVEGQVGQPPKKKK